MREPPRLPFLARRSYRWRRLTEALRLMPVLGALLFLLPILWASRGDGSAWTSSGVAYLFIVWIVLILLAGLLARRIARADDEDAEGPG